MKGLTHHKIRRATIDLQFNGTTDGFSLQQEVRDWFDEFIAELDEEFKSLTVNDQVIQIELFELEVSLEARDWRKQASQKIISQLKDRLRLMQAGQVRSPGFKEKTVGRQFEESFLHYLEYGYLPWPSSGLSAELWNEQLKLLIDHANMVFANELVRILLRSANALQRFIQLVPVQFGLQLIQADRSYPSPDHENFIHDLAMLIEVNLLRQDSVLRRVFYRALLLSYSNERDISTIEQQVLEVLQQKLANQTNLRKHIEKIAFRSPAFIARKKSGVIVNRVSEEKKETKESKKKSFDIQEQTPLSDEIRTDEVVSQESIFISNAGLIIVAPFLPGLFETLQLAKDGIIHDEAKAIFVTHFLATGDREIQEYELPLAKILCGVSVQKPVNVNSIRFTKEMLKETEKVLSSVIMHWSILQNTSVEGLRESFLKRNGKLHFNRTEWLLQVEQQPYDMLLQHLPWSISMIKLSWMKYMLKTEWVF